MWRGGFHLPVFSAQWENSPPLFSPRQGGGDPPRPPHPPGRPPPLAVVRLSHVVPPPRPPPPPPPPPPLLVHPHPPHHCSLGPLDHLAVLQCLPQIGRLPGQRLEVTEAHQGHADRRLQVHRLDRLAQVGHDVIGRGAGQHVGVVVGSHQDDRPTHLPVA